jgi:hypothetical protein
VRRSARCASSPRSYGERVGVRGCFREFDLNCGSSTQLHGRDASRMDFYLRNGVPCPSPGSLARSDLSPQKSGER